MDKTRSITTIHEFTQTARELWGTEQRNSHQMWAMDVPRIQDFVRFKEATRELKIHLADTMIREGTPRCGSFCDNGDLRWFLLNFGREMNIYTGPFDSRRSPVMQAAVILLSYAYQPQTSALEAEFGDLAVVFGAGGAGLASQYLLTQVEYLFRLKGNYLDEEGVITRPIPPVLAALPALGLKGKRVGRSRINRIDAAFALYLCDNTDTLAVRLAQLDKDISIGGRLGHIRPSVAHGTLGDASSEGLFYGLLLSMFYYSECR